MNFLDEGKVNSQFQIPIIKKDQIFNVNCISTASTENVNNEELTSQFQQTKHFRPYLKNKIIPISSKTIRLTHFIPLDSFFTHCKHQKTSGILCFQGV